MRKELIKCAQYLLQVYVSGSLIHDQDLVPFQQSSCQAEQLSLSNTEICPALTDWCLQATFEAFHHTLQLDLYKPTWHETLDTVLALVLPHLLKSTPHSLVIIDTERIEIVSNGAAKQHRIL